ncbi:UPF0223 family protein [Ureibacillus manganicus]|uniref:UPF0223 protein CD29_00960 n=1 Tax=Ureibacillus manganicus DSM 26584 TaxID=1384049 RepID=A0A0A3J0A7_9BACL|nr:UPF0223 family protein [Ureibacillus manganicus]KGR80492.1 hypothetical protein CD29_00960 [Ureibacillus manganicus DSM 26584]
MEYSYPISPDWSTEEIIAVVQFFEGIEKAYEKGIMREEMLTRYRKFKEVVPSQAEEKSIFREFEEESGYVSYTVVKQAKELENGQTIKVLKK